MGVIAILSEAFKALQPLVPIGAVRRDTAANTGEADGKFGLLTLDAAGRLRVAATPSYDDTLPTPYTLQTASADTAAHAFGAQAVKTPVTVTVAPTMTGTLTIDDGTHSGVVLDAVNRNGVFFCQNLNQLRYTFSVNAGTEKFSVSCGI